MEVRSYRDLKVWQKALDLVVESYRITEALPRKETYGLSSQLQRAAIAVPANIAEGHGRDHLGDYLHHLPIANGSLMELETHLILAERPRYIPAERLQQVLELSGEVSRMLSGLTRTLKDRQQRSKPHQFHST